MANKTIQELDAIELADNDLLPVWDTSDGQTKKSAISEMKQKIVGTVDSAATPASNNLITSGAVAAACSYCASDNTTVTGPALFNGAVVKIMFTSAITGSDTTTPLAINYNGTPYNVKATSNGSLKNFTATPIETETREQTKGKSEEESETKGVEGTRATTTTYVYCQAYTTLELMFDGTQFIIMGNPVVISSADYTIYTDGNKRVNEVTANNMGMVTSNAVCNTFTGLTKKTTITGGFVSYRKLTLTRLSNYSCGVFLLCSRDNVYILEVRMNVDGVSANLTCLGTNNSYISKAEYKSNTDTVDVYFTLPTWAITFEVTQLNFLKTMDFSVVNIENSAIPSDTTVITIKVL